MNASIIVMILRAVFCDPDLRAWLEKQAQATDTPIDNLAVKIVYMLLTCNEER